MKILNTIALCVGWTVLTALALLILFLICYTIKVAARRPYYCIKFLLPGKRKNEEDWKQHVEYFTKRNNLAPLLHYHYIYEFTRHGQFGRMRNVGTHRWWEPTNRFFWIK